MHLLRRKYLRIFLRQVTLGKSLPIKAKGLHHHHVGAAEIFSSSCNTIGDDSLIVMVLLHESE